MVNTHWLAEKYISQTGRKLLHFMKWLRDKKKMCEYTIREQYVLQDPSLWKWITDRMKTDKWKLINQQRNDGSRKRNEHKNDLPMFSFGWRDDINFSPSDWRWPCFSTSNTGLCGGNKEKRVETWLETAVLITSFISNDNLPLGIIRGNRSM